MEGEILGLMVIFMFGALVTIITFLIFMLTRRNHNGDDFNGK